MTHTTRRDFLNAALAVCGTVLMEGSTEGAYAQQAPAGAQGLVSATPKHAYRTRDAKVEILFTAPGLSGNGLQCTDEGIWTIDVAGSRSDTPGRCKVYLSSYAGRLIRELSPEGTGPSGIGFDGASIWIGSTYSREIIRADAKTGETMEKHFTPGAGVIYARTTDVPARPDTYGQKARAAAQGNATPARSGAGRQGTPGGSEVRRGPAVAGPPAPGTGAHGIQAQNGRLWVSVPPSRTIYRINPATWIVEHMFPTVGYRPHGIGIESEDATYLWESDTNMGTFFKRDMQSGEVVDALRLPDGAPFPHGASVHNGHIFWVDDIGGGLAPVCRTKI